MDDLSVRSWTANPAGSTPTSRYAKTKAGKRVRLTSVPDGFGDGLLCTIDRNGSYPSACSAVPLAPNKLLPTGPLKEVGKDQAGAFLITVPVWNHRDMPHPLGRLAERTDDQGRAWVTTPHVRLLQKLIKNDFITEPLSSTTPGPAKPTSPSSSPSTQRLAQPVPNSSRPAASPTPSTSAACPSRCACCGPRARRSTRRSGAPTGA